MFRIEPSTVFFPATFITSEATFAVDIFNDSSEKVDYKWSIFESSSAENKNMQVGDILDLKERNSKQDIREFNHAIFQPVQNSGEIWPNRSVKTTITFRPQEAHQYVQKLYIDFGEGHERIPIELKGTGLPPEAAFDVATIAVGHIPLDTVQEYKVELINLGSVEVEFEYEKNTDSPLKFNFSPSKGKIPVGERMPIVLTMAACQVGNFNETFTFKIRGAVKTHPTLLVYGRVDGPVYTLSSKQINFGDVSYGFLYSKTFTIENKTNIPFDYKLHFEQNTTFAPREFSVKPSSGTVDKFSTKTITIELIPNTIQHYEVKLWIDIQEFQNNVDKVKIYANCISPTVVIPNPVMKCENVFINYPYEKNFHFENTSALPAKYEIYVEDMGKSAPAIVEFTKLQGVIEPNSKMKTPVKVTPLILGPISVPCYLKIDSSTGIVIPWSISAVSIGPTLEISHKHINFGTIPVLKDKAIPITITNTSLIPIEYSITIESDNTSFNVKQKEGKIEPSDKAQIPVIANLDDTLTFNGKLMLNIQYLNPISIPLAATGSGTPMYSSIPMDTIDYGYILNERIATMTFSMTNKGGRTQELRWSYGRNKIPEAAQKSFRISISPEVYTIESHDTIEYTVQVFCPMALTFSCELICNATVGRQRVELFHPVIKGIIFKPNLSFSTKQLEFEHIHNYKREEEISVKSMESLTTPSFDLLPIQESTFDVVNINPIPLDLEISTIEPFTTDVTSIHLDTNQSKTIVVTFNAPFKTDFFSESITRKISFSIVDHPAKIWLNAKCNYIFPNLAFEPSTSVDFGNMMLNTEEDVALTMKSVSNSPVEWCFELMSKEADKAISRIFDVFPIKGTMNPFGTDTIHFSFSANASPEGGSKTYSGKAICHVTGGPDYIIDLKGNAVSIDYSITPTSIDFGDRFYNETLVYKINLKNGSDLPIKYTTKVPKSNELQQLSISPSDGSIPVEGTYTLTVTCLCGKPGTFSDYFLVQIGHYEEQKIPIHVNAYFPQLSIAVPRHETDYAFQANPEASNEELLALESKLAIERESQKLPYSNNRQERERLTQQKKIFSRYLYDVGQIIVGDTIENAFDIKSLIPLPLLININNDSLKGTGFYLNSQTFTMQPKEESTFSINFDTAKRTNNTTGPVEYSILLSLGEQQLHIIEIVIKATIVLPKFTLSTKTFNFDEVIVGQSKTMTLQIQNMNTFPCEFQFLDQELSMSSSASKAVTARKAIEKKKSTQKLPNEEEEEEEQPEKPIIYQTKPNSGILPPSSFQNIEITFTPKEGIPYNIRLPLKMKHNPHNEIVRLNGKGVQMKIEFDPPSLSLPAILPFADSSISDIKLMNNTNYPIEVFSYNFDYQLYVNTFIKKKQESEAPTESNESVANVSKFSICCIVHGPAQTGRTTVSNIIAKYLNTPVISLNELWAPILERPEGHAAADLIGAFATRIQDSDCLNGFVVDGLDALPINQDTEVYLQQCVKAKGCIDEANNNPFNPIPHNTPTNVELALNYIIDSLDGHYIFFVGVKCPIDVINKRHEEEERQEKKRQARERQNEKIALFNMTEEEYEKLSPEEQEEIDKKRKALRKKILKAEQATIEEETSRSSSHKHRSKTSSRENKDKEGKEGKEREKESRHRDRKEEKSSKGERSKKEEEKSSKGDKPPPKKEERRSGKKGVPTDPLELSAMLYNLTVGSLTNKLKTSCDSFQAIDPSNLVKQEKPSEEEDKKELTIDLSEKPPEETTENNPPPVEIVEEPVQRSIKNFNAMLLNTDISLKEIEEEIIGFIPSLTTIKENAFTSLIPGIATGMANDMEEPLSKFKETSPYFSIIVEEPYTELPEAETTGRTSKSKISRPGARKKSQPEETVDITKLTPRWKIDANSFVTLQIRFMPTIPGNFRTDLYFGIIGCKYDILKINVSGACAGPDIERNIVAMFENKAMWNQQENEYQFGPVLLAGKQKGSTPISEKITLKNISQFPADVHAFFSDPNKQVWSIDPTVNTIPAGGTSTFTVTITPQTTELIKNIVQFFIKDQPEPLSIPFSAESTIPAIKLSTTTLDFDKIMLGKNRTLNIEMKNTSKLFANWNFKNLNNVGDLVKFTATEGVIKPMKSMTVKATFAATKAATLKKAINFEVFDKEKARNFGSTPIQVLGEAFDVVLDVQFPKGMDHLNFGNFTLSQTKTINVVLKDKGKFPVTYKIIIDKNIEQYITANPNTGTIAPTDKPITVVFTLKSGKVISFQDAKGIKMQIQDTNSKVTTETLPLPFTCETVYSSCQIQPNKKLSFDYVPVGQVPTKQVTIVNTGKFAFEFELIPRADSKPKMPIMPVDSKRMTGNLLKPKNRKNVQHVIAGQYVLSPSTGTVAPGQSCVIDVEFNATSPGTFNNTVNVRVSEIDPNVPTPIIQLTGIVEAPSLEIASRDKIFPGLPLSVSTEKLKTDKNVFFEDSGVLHFAALMVHDKSSVPISIINASHIAVSVELNVKSAKQKDKNFPFEVSESKFNLEPLAQKQINVSFCPLIAETFTGVFEAVIKGAPVESKLKFNVEGIGSVPNFNIVGLEKLKGTNFMCIFNKVLIGYKKERAININNPTALPVTVSIQYKKSPEFVVFPDTQSETIQPGETFPLVVSFKPTQEIKYSMDITVGIESNPKSNCIVTISGEGAVEDILFEFPNASGDEDQLEFKNCIVGSMAQQMFIIKNVGSEDCKFSWPSNTGITFVPSVGHVRAGKSKKITASLLTDHPIKQTILKIPCNVLKIQLDPHAPDWDDSMRTLKFIKRNLQTPAEKENVVSGSKLPPLNPRKSAKTSMSVKRNSIKELPPIENQSVVSDMVKVAEVREEPSFKLLTPKPREVPIHAVTAADVVKFALDTTEIAFSPTMMMQSRTFDVKMTNQSQIKMEFQWRDADYSSARSDYAASHVPPFDIAPRHGFIESGQSQSFKVTFSPEEVDDFVGKIVCDIPFNTGQSPIINVSGLSRRPIIYFNVEQSDYLTRRYPGYTRSVPAETRIVEIGVPSSHSSRTMHLKFDVVNTTSQPYEFSWTKSSTITDGEEAKAINCETPCGMISGGKKVVMNFSFTPGQQRTVESNYEFLIPSLGVRVPFLVVGRLLQ